MVEVKNSHKMKNIFVGRLNTDKERISELEDGSRVVVQTKTQKKKEWGKRWNRTSKNCGTIYNEVM